MACSLALANNVGWRLYKYCRPCMAFLNKFSQGWKRSLYSLTALRMAFSSHRMSLGSFSAVLRPLAGEYSLSSNISGVEGWLPPNRSRVYCSTSSRRYGLASSMASRNCLARDCSLGVPTSRMIRSRMILWRNRCSHTNSRAVNFSEGFDIDSFQRSVPRDAA